MIKVFQTFCVLVVFVLSCHAKNCCFPDQFESTVKQVIRSSGTTGRSSYSVANYFVSFDTLGKRIYVEEDIYVDKKKYSLVQLLLYGKGVLYNVFHNTTCGKFKLKPWTDQNCIPDYAVKLPPSSLGMKARLKVQDYYWIKDGVINTMTVTSDTCVPVFDQYENFPRGITLGIAKIENVTPGIKNPHIFDVPDICKHIQLVEETATRRPLFPF